MASLKRSIPRKKAASAKMTRQPKDPLRKIGPALLKKKANLINEGRIYIPKDLILPVYPSRSTAGPGAGHTSLAFDLGGTRVKLGIVRTPSRFSLGHTPKGFTIFEGDKAYIKNVRIEPILMHAPRQAFINLDSQCIYRCAFCNSWRLEEKWAKGYPLEKWAALIIEASKREDFTAVAITTSIPVNVKDSIDKILALLNMLRDGLPAGTPIGVEPCMDDPRDIVRLKEAGATELKINVQAATKEIYERVCPGMDYEAAFALIAEAGRQMPVCSNIIVGLGETDKDVRTAVERLARLNCAANVRAVRIDDMNRKGLEDALGRKMLPVEPSRLIRLARMQRKILKKFNIDTRQFKTMCHSCMCCDIEPFKDV
jgi:biotin synthase-related radical SAM superfamily protein